MTDTTTVTEGTQVPTDGTQGPADTAQATQGTEDTTGPENGNREAARYRSRLRETEAERDTLAGRLDAMQRAEVERLAGQHLRRPAGLWAAGVTLADVTDEAGSIDPGKVKAAAAQAATDLGLARSTDGGVAPKVGKYPEPPTGDAWAHVISGQADDLPG